MRKNLANYDSTMSNPGKNSAEKNSVNSVTKQVALAFETAEDHLMKNKNAPKQDLSAYASEMQNRLG